MVQRKNTTPAASSTAIADAEHVGQHVDRTRSPTLGVGLGREQLVHSDERAHEIRGETHVAVRRRMPVLLEERDQVFEHLSLVRRPGQIDRAGEHDPPLGLRQGAAHGRRFELVADRLVREARGEPGLLLRAVQIVHRPSQERRGQHQGDAGGERDQAKPDGGRGQRPAELHPILDGDGTFPGKREATR